MAPSRSDLRQNWRIILLVLFVVVATAALFSPSLTLSDDAGGGGVASEGEAASGMTTLKYGIQLSGGTRIRAPLLGQTAENVELGSDDPAAVESAVAGELESVPPSDVVVRLREPETGVVEIRDENVTQEQLAAALEANSYEYGTIREGVTEETREQTRDVLRNKINEAGLSGGTVRIVTASTGDHYMLIQAPDVDSSSVIDLIDERGSVRVDLYYPTGNGEYATEEEVLSQEDFQRVGTATEGEGQQPPFVPVVIDDGEAERVQQTMVDTGVASQGGSQCRYRTDPENTEACLLLVVDGEVVNAFGMSPGLADSMRTGEWAQDPRFILQTRGYDESRSVAINLRAGELPAKLAVTGDQGGTISFISAAAGESFRTLSLLIGVIAVLAVSLMVFVRYGRTVVAAPMIVTALSEVVILLGFAAFIRFPLDLSVIAGFIAVIGTGVDDLIIIADEVMSQGEVNSRRVFQSRFRKAFWVIGAAAATTIIAMSPLAVLSLGDLQGFAIFTILGVIVGVTVTRPAYGDILRGLLTDR
jgi:preprotein translocase subunit SecD